MIRPIAILLATSVAACAYEAPTPIWPDVPKFEYPAPRAEPRKPQVRGWKHHVPPRTIIKRDVVVISKTPTTKDFRCKPYVAAIGDSAKSEAAAKLEAQKSWKGVVQFEHGNKYLDLQNADSIEYQCGPSSVPKFGGLIENAASKFLPIESITCRLSAQPCASPVQRDDGK